MPKRWSSCDELENAFCLVVYHCRMEVLKFYSAISHISYGVDFKVQPFFVCVCTQQSYQISSKTPSLNKML